jgi:hypothetical protein
MTNEPKTKGAQKRGTLAAQLGGVAAAIAALFIAVAGTITWFTALLLIGGLIALVVGLIQRNNDRG